MTTTIGYNLIEAKYKDLRLEELYDEEELGYHENKDKVITILDNAEFEVIYNGDTYYVECYPLDQHDTYVIRVYKTDCHNLSEETEVSHCYRDSSGGGFYGERIDLFNDDYDTEELENFIEDKLFNPETGLVKEF